MSQGENLYQPPNARIVEDFIAVEPRRRSLSNLIVAALYLIVGFMLSAIDIIFVYTIIVKWIKAGTRWENQPARLDWGEYIIFPMAASAICFVFSGQYFWRVENRRGTRWGYTALGFLALMILPPLVTELLR